MDETCNHCTHWWDGLPCCASGLTPEKCQEYIGEHPVIQFVKTILHGNEEHQAWLIEAAENFVKGRAIPERRG